MFSGTESEANFLLSLQGLLNDHKDAVDFIMEQQNIVSHINDKILDTKKRYLNFITPSGK